MAGYMWLPVVTDRAMTIIKNNIGPGCVEFSEINISGLYILNVIDFIDCLDLKQSVLYEQIDRSNVESRIKYVIDEEKARGHAIFKSVEDGGLAIFASDEFCDLCDHYGLCGLEFFDPKDAGFFFPKPLRVPKANLLTRLPKKPRIQKPGGMPPMCGSFAKFKPNP